jgi:outer membrane biosynthesis protein TonB
VAERVREIVSEAEQRAAKIVSDAEAEAERIRARAEEEADERLTQVRSALAELQTRLGDGAAAAAKAKPGAGTATKAEVEPGPVVVPEPEPPAVPEPEPPPVPEPAPEPAPQPQPPTIPEPTPPPDEGTPPQVAGADAGAKADDQVAARLVAMNMALDGDSREKIEAHLASSYELDDAGAIVDDVLAATT